jgi:hypothetical protein
MILLCPTSNPKHNRQPKSTMAQSASTASKNKGPKDWMNQNVPDLQAECKARCIFNESKDLGLKKYELSGRLSCFDAGLFDGQNFDATALRALTDLWHIAGTNGKTVKDVIMLAKIYNVSGIGTRAQIIASVAQKLREQAPTLQTLTSERE